MATTRKFPIPLLVTSIGNPEAVYGNTLHSAGHTILNRVRELLGIFKPFQQNKRLGGLACEAIRQTNFSILPFVNRTREVEVADNWTLWKSPTLMNVSGPAVRKAWEHFRRENPDGLLVVVHDDLEKGKGVVTVKRGGSAKGHNGIKSVTSAMGGIEFVKIGVGIGRPLSREPTAVATYVLRKMKPQEQNEIENAAGPVIEALRAIQDGLL